MKDIFGRPVQAGDKIAAGMSYGQSSVLRVGEVLYVKEKVDPHRPDHVKWSVRVRWTHNGAPTSRWEVKESTILGDSLYRYAKILVLPEGFVDQFPSDITEED